jgi:hypothetical protein
MVLQQQQFYGSRDATLFTYYKAEADNGSLLVDS